MDVLRSLNHCLMRWAVRSVQTNKMAFLSEANIPSEVLAEIKKKVTKNTGSSARSFCPDSHPFS